MNKIDKLIEQVMEGKSLHEAAKWTAMFKARAKHYKVPGNQYSADDWFNETVNLFADDVENLVEEYLNMLATTAPKKLQGLMDDILKGVAGGW